ncbi:MAG: ACP S-malonyltransferase [Proteobacteria bacterium]|nr:ACP S-malonyltransferase [Pseudomonadota bacterium]
MKTAFVFPGQGAQQVGMGRALYDNFAEAKAVFDEADAVLGESQSDLIFNGPIENLSRTANTQPAIITVSIAALRAFQSRSPLQPDFVAGHSLGEYAALVAANAMSLADAVTVTRARGTFMQEAVPEGQGAMAAVLKLDDETVRAICRDAAQGEVVAPANFNSPGQIVISGHAAAVQRATALAKERGGRAIPLKVSAPFHCELMKPAATKLEKHLAGLNFSAPKCPLVTNVTGTKNTNPDATADLLVQQVTAPVRWTDSVHHMIAQGVTRFIEFGPGNVLAGLIAKTNAAVQVLTVNTPEGIDNALQLLNEETSQPNGE